MASSDNISFVIIDGKKYPSPGLGLMSIGNAYQKVSDEEARDVLAKAVEVGQYLKESGHRDRVYVATKFGIEWSRETGKPVGRGRGDDQYIRQCVTESTERLGFVPDLYYQHRQDQTGVPVEETWATLVTLQKEGKLKALGVSEVNADTLRRILKVAKVSALQIEYSPLERDVETNGLLDLCRENDIAIVAYAPIGRGLAGGTFKSYDELKNDVRGGFPRFDKENFERNYALTKKLQELADRKGATVAQISIAWVSAQQPFVIPIPGTRKAKNVEENFKAGKVELTNADLQELRRIIDGHTSAGKRYPAGLQKLLDGMDN